MLPQIRKTGRYIPEGQTDTEAFKTISNEFNAAAAHLISQDFTTAGAMQMANSAIDKIYNVNYLEASSLQNTTLKTLTNPYTGRLLAEP